MNRVVLDTNVASNLSRAWESDRSVLDALNQEWDLALSFMTVRYRPLAERAACNK